MTNYYIEQNNKIILWDTDLEKLSNTIVFLSDIPENIEIKQTEDEIVYRNNEFVFANEIQAELLEDARQLKIDEINAAKETAFKSGFFFNNSHFDCDDRAQIRLSAQLAIAKQDDTIIWLDYDYNPVTFTYEEFVQMCQVAISIVSNIEFETSTLLEAAAEASSVDELNLLSINYNAVISRTQQETESEDTNE